MRRFLQSLAARFGWQISRIGENEHKFFTEPAACDYDSSILKGFANRAAAFTISSLGSQAIRNIHLSGLLRDQPVLQHLRIEVGNENTLQVGIWRKASSGKSAAFVREPHAARFEWADKQQIEAKRTKWRIAVIGESVARGYLYDPDFSPAAVLDHMLQSRFAPGDIDVVDLAKLSLSIHPLK